MSLQGSLINRKLLLELRGKKNGEYDLWKKEQAAKEKDVIKPCKEKIRKRKAQLEFNLTTAVKENKSVFINILTKGRPSKNLHPFLNAGGTTDTKDEKKA